MRVKGLAVRSPNGGGDEEREREGGGRKRGREGVYVLSRAALGEGEVM